MDVPSALAVGDRVAPASSLDAVPRDADHAINQRIFETSRDLILVVDRRGTFIRVSPSSQAILGYDPAEMVGRSATEFLLPEDLDNTRSEMRQARHGHVARDFQCRYIHRGGRPVTLWWTGVWSEPEGQYFFIGRDITEREEAERRLRDSEVRFGDLRAAIETIPDGFVIYDNEDRVVVCNEAYRNFYPENADRHLIGLRFEEILRQGIAAGRFPQAAGREEEWIVERIRRHRETSNTIEQQVADGRWVLVTKHLMPNGWVAGLRIDITALKAAQSALSESEGRLRQSQKMEAIGNLTGGLAHDFNNLLGIIIGNLDLAETLVASNGEAVPLIREATEAALSGAELTRQLLAFARKQPLRPEHIETNELVADFARLLRRTLGENIEVALDLGANLWPVVADPAQVGSALTNLATNARDAMPRGGRLTIATANRQLDADYAASHAEVTAGDYVAIEVTDTGCGMTPEIVERVFEPFYTTKETGKGTGLGLSMVFGFIKQSGGHVSVYSEPGIGTTFRLYLPRVASAADAATETAAGAGARRGTGETVLAVEDNERLRRLVMRQLSGLGYRPFEAASPAEALAILDRERVDVLFSDIVMPGPLDGIGLARLVREKWPGVKIVFTSGFPGARLDDESGWSGGAVSLLSKPYRAEDLAVALREALDG
jgi:PAS domain S-box-containing protein